MTITHALERIARGTAVRSPELAADLGITEAKLDELLRPACEDGRLVSCRVTVGHRQVTEYRCSASGGLIGRAASSAGMSRLFTPKPITPPRPDRVTAPATRDAAPKGESVKFDKEKVKELFRAHGPMTSRELTKFHGVQDAARMCALIAGNGEFGILGGGTRSKVYGLPEQSMADRKPQPEKPAGDKPPRSIHRRKKAAKHGRRKGSSKAAKRAWKTRCANAAKNGGAAAKVAFRPALCADGALIFMGAERGDFEIAREQVRGLVKLIRGLTPREIPLAVGFIESLDRAEVGA